MMIRQHITVQGDDVDSVHDDVLDDVDDVDVDDVNDMYMTMYLIMCMRCA